MKLMDLTQNTDNVEEKSEKESMLDVSNKKAKVNTNSGPRTSAMERAQELQANLVSRAPSFTKIMTKSQVSGSYLQLCLPIEFCRVHLPKVNSTIVLVNENEKEYNTEYVPSKGKGGWKGLRDGWEGFSIAHKLVEGDAVVFQLIEPLKFKVYIIRELENLNCHQAEDQNNDIRDKKRQKCTESIVEGIQLTKSITNFKDVKSFEDFSIHVNGIIFNSDQISPHLIEKYYNLCCSQNSFLHDNLSEGCSKILATGIISETTNIADAIRAAKSTTSLKQLESWDKTLKAFEDLGMGVGFLRDRIHKLLSVSNDARAKTIQRNKSVQEMKSVMEELGNLLKSVKGLDAEIKEYDSAFEEVSSASW